MKFHFTRLISFLLGTQLVSGANYNNPVLWEDYPDLEVIRVGSVYYYTSSTFAYSPGAPVLKSYDLVNWTPVSHSVPTLNFGNQYNLGSAGRAYVKGIWASTLRYRASTDTFHWMGCVDGKTYIWTSTGGGAKNNDGEVSSWNWQAKGSIGTCYYDCGMLVDDDDKIYVAYGNTKISVAQLSSDGLSQVKTQQVFSSSDTIEGSRMYKINGSYYIFVTRPANAEYVLKASNPFGPYERRDFVVGVSGPISGAGTAHQGGIIDTKDGKCYYMAFMDAYPGGRIPVLAPITWSNGWPTLTKSGNGWGKSYPMPVETTKTVPSPLGTDYLNGSALSHEWEWNHNPDTSKFQLSSNGLVLQTAFVTNDPFAARNTLTHRIFGPKSVATFRLDTSKMQNGDHAGAILFRDVAAYIGVHKDSSGYKVVYVNGLSLSSNWATASTGTVAATGPTLSAANAADVWFRINSDVTPAYGQNGGRTATFSYSTDGSKFTQLGGAFTLNNAWQYFTGYRYGVLNFATSSLGGQITVKSFTQAAT